MNDRHNTSLYVTDIKAENLLSHNTVLSQNLSIKFDAETEAFVTRTLT